MTVPSKTLPRRYPGVRPFRDKPDEQALFFGRSSEIEQLYFRVRSVPLLLLFAKSGLGKTSLLQAGLFPKLRNDPLLPVLVRLNTEQAEQSLVNTVSLAMESACQIEGLDYTPGDMAGLWEFLKTTVVWRDEWLLTPVLVFDQFEEVFTLRTREFRERLVQELAELVSGEPPERLVSRLLEQEEEQEADRVLRQPPRVKIIISLREEYLAALEEFSSALPKLFVQRLRLGPISVEGARKAIVGPAMAECPEEVTYWSPSFGFDDEALEGIIAFLAGKSGAIEPFHLQLLCQHAEEVAVKKSGVQKEPIQLSMVDLGGAKELKTILKRFYKNTLYQLPRKQRRLAARLCEWELLDVNGHRLMLTKEQIFVKLRKLKEETLEVLTKGCLLTREIRLDSIFYEISHDRLAESIQQARSTISPKARACFKWLLAGVGGLVIFVLLLGMWGYGINQERERAEQLLSFMLGEPLQSEMQDVGRGDLLQMMLKKSEEYAIDADPLNRGLSLRNRGAFQLTRGNLAAATDSLRQAQTIFETLAATHKEQAQAELARCLMLKGNALADSGKIEEAVKNYEEAVRIHRILYDLYAKQQMPHQVLASYALKSNPAIELANSLDSLGSIYARTGHYQQSLESVEQAIEVARNHLFGMPLSGNGADESSGFNDQDVEPNPAALKVLASAVVNRSNRLRDSLGVNQGFDQGLFLVRQLVLAKPLSAEPRLTECQTRFWKAYAAGGNTLDAYKKALEGMEELTRVDPENVLWRREWATVQDWLSGEILDACLRNEEKMCPNKPVEVSKAALGNLASLEVFRTLVEKDDVNLSLKLDLTSSLQLRTKFLKETGNVRERFQVFDETIEFISRATDQDPSDTGSQLALISALWDRADAWQEQGEKIKALTDIQAARALYERLVEKHPEHPQFRYGYKETLKKEILLHDDEQEKDAHSDLARLEKEQQNVIQQMRDDFNQVDKYHNQKYDEQLKIVEQAKKDSKSEKAIQAYRNAVEILRAGIAAKPKDAEIWVQLATTQQNLAVILGVEGQKEPCATAFQQAIDSFQQATTLAPRHGEYQNKLGVAYYTFGDFLKDNKAIEEALPQFQRALPCFHAAVTLRPVEPTYYVNILDTLNRMKEIYEQRSGETPEELVKLLQERQGALTQRVQAAWFAWAFAKDEGRKKQAMQLVQAKRDLSKFFAFEVDQPGRALALMEQAERIAEEVVSDGPSSAECHCRLGEVHYGVGFLRRDVGIKQGDGRPLPGWEESIRLGLLNFDQGIALIESGKNISDVNEAICFYWSGLYRKKLGEFLFEDQRLEESKKVLKEALTASRKAMSYYPDDSKIKEDIQSEMLLLEQVESVVNTKH